MSTLRDPAVKHATVTPHDTTNFAGGNCSALYIGGIGNIVIVDTAGTAVTYAVTAVPTIIPIRARRVNATNTTATGIVALFN